MITASLIVMIVMTMLMSIVAAELRHEWLTGQTADGTTAENADAEFRNDSSRMIHIREIDMNSSFDTAGINEFGRQEVSKSPVLASGTNNNVFFAQLLQIAARGGAADGASQSSKRAKYGRGQLTLEPNESLFVNTFKTTGGDLVYRNQISYEF